jgi:hypothetical protein
MFRQAFAESLKLRGMVDERLLTGDTRIRDVSQKLMGMKGEGFLVPRAKVPQG